MKTNQKYFVIAIITTIAILIMVITFGNYSYIEEEKFHSDYPVGSDTYMEDSLAFVHPNWDYEQICDSLYGPMDKPEYTY